MAQTVKTLEDIAQLDCAYLVPTQVAPVLGCASYAINVMARTQEGRNMLGFPVIVLGKRCKIPRVPFLQYMGWRCEDGDD